MACYLVWKGRVQLILKRIPQISKKKEAVASVGVLYLTIRK